MKTSNRIYTFIIIQILISCFLFSNNSILAKEHTKNDSLVKIDSISTDHQKYVTDKELTFKGTFFDPEYTDVYSIIWDFGDGHLATGTLTTSTDMYANPGRCSPYKNECFSTITASNIYKKSGAYKVTFSVKNSNGDLYTDSEEIIVEDITATVK